MQGQWSLAQSLSLNIFFRNGTKGQFLLAALGQAQVMGQVQGDHQEVFQTIIFLKTTLTTSANLAINLANIIPIKDHFKLHLFTTAG